uniref:Uncharacterized protein n=1 Tax=Mycena chlorophos TaxID=658473 RepID=A0ABQ0LB54_MYCCL|nr:predicted protein [Mycena chlorophos]
MFHHNNDDDETGERWIQDPVLHPENDKIVSEIPGLLDALSELMANSATRTRRSLEEATNAWVSHAVQSTATVFAIEQWFVRCIAMDFEKLQLAISEGCKSFFWLQYNLCNEEGGRAEALVELLRLQVKGIRAASTPEVNLHTEPSDINWPSASPRRQAIYDTVDSAMPKLLQRFYNVLHGYYRVNPTSSIDDMIDALCDARAVPASVYKKPAWARGMSKNGLTQLLSYVTDPKIRHEVLLPHTSNGKYNWRQYWTCLHHKWTPNASELSASPEVFPCGTNLAKPDALNFLAIVMNDERFLTQMTANPENACLLLSQDNFVWGWHHWLAATIKAMQFVPSVIPSVDDGWDLRDLFRELGRITIDGQVLHLQKASRKLERPLHPLLEAVFTISARSRMRLKEMQQEAHHPTRPEASNATTPPKRPRKKARMDLNYGSDTVSITAISNDAELGPRRQCPHCDPDDPCIRYYDLTKQAQRRIDLFKGAYFTEATDNDYVGHHDEARSYDPIRDFGFKVITSRPHVMKSCGRDITIFRTVDGSERVFRFAVRYNAFSPRVLEELRSSHANVAEYAKETKRKAKTQAAGKIRSLGARMPQTGRRADGLGVFSCQDASTPENVEAFLSAAHANDILLEHARSFAPNVVKEIRKTASESSLLPFGRTSMMSFYCEKYASPQHTDLDAAWSLCCQLWKKAGLNEYSFVFAEWGIVIRTEENCLWIFKPTEVHGTLLPRKSTYQHTVSSGIHTTIRSRDATASNNVEQARVTYASRRDYWNAH